MNLENKLIENFTEYANYVNNERAITHYYDGLKPVMRRILYTMYNMKLKPEGQTKKCATIVGKTLEFHPHGESGVYNALARSAQDFSLLIPIIYGSGNFGSLDMGPAAMRYTEAKISDFGYTLVKGLQDKIVPTVPNYDGTTEEPLFLPVPFPYLLVNGTSGIGVGMAASIPSHNLTDVLNMMSYFILNPDATSADLVDKLIGPDFNSGCEIVNKENFKEIYSKGNGSFKMRAKFTINGGQIKATNLPYKISGARIMEQLTAAQERGECSFIKNVIDMSSAEEVLLIDISTKDTDMAIKELCRVSDLEKSFSLDFSVVLETPQRVNLRDYLEAWTTTHKKLKTLDLNQQKVAAEDRKHIIDGFLKALKNIDEIIQLIKQSNDRADAKQNLEIMGFSAIQANAILDMKLSRLTKLNGIELEKEHAELESEIARLNLLLTDSIAFDKYLISEFESYRYLVKPRRSKITQNVFPKTVKDINTNFSIILNKGKAIISEGVSSKGINGNKEHPVYLLVENNVVPVKDAKDTLIPNVFAIVDNRTKSIFHISEDGFIKKTMVEDIKTSRKAIVAKQNKVIEVLLHDESEKELYVLLTLNTQKQIQFKISDINPTGRNTRGVTAVKLRDGELVVKAEWLEKKKDNVFVGRNKYIPIP